MTGVHGGVEALRGAIDGAVSLPGEAAYDTAVSIWNGVIERRPAVVASCASSGDVAAALALRSRRGSRSRYVAGATTTRATRCARTV